MDEPGFAVMNGTLMLRKAKWRSAIGSDVEKALVRRVVRETVRGMGHDVRTWNAVVGRNGVTGKCVKCGMEVVNCDVFGMRGRAAEEKCR